MELLLLMALCLSVMTAQEIVGLFVSSIVIMVLILLAYKIGRDK